MLKFKYLIALILLVNIAYSQAKVDLDRSVPLWLEYDSTANLGTLKWIGDENATNYYVSKVTNTTNLTPLVTLDGEATEYIIGPMNKGEQLDFHIRKNVVGRGIISVGIELPTIHQRGRCLIVIDDILPNPLNEEIDQLMEDISMDGWEADTIHVAQNDLVVDVKERIKEWYDEDYELSQSLFLLGHVPVPYSGNTEHDGHSNHQGAWAADVFYGELDGNWTDASVNNITPSREKNRNIPGDGKYDQTLIPSTIDLEVGRVDFNDLPAFELDELELTRQYLNKNHEFKVGNKEYPRRALIENNFGSFAEGFGQSGWRNFPTLFGGDSVTTQNYEVVLETDKYLFSYACGGGSYTSCSGVGNTTNLWAAKNLQSVFTMNFGSYFGDWDSQNNFLRAALGSGDILTNAWSGRPIWQIYNMALGGHIGTSTRNSQNAFGTFYSMGNSTRGAHMALLGDPTLRLHPVKRPQELTATFTDRDIILEWKESTEATHGYHIYKREAGMDWLLIADSHEEQTLTDHCVNSNTAYEYMVKAVRLEETGSGSYFNTSLGIATTIVSGENPFITTYYADADMDGFGDPDAFLTACDIPPGHAENDLDCDDMNSDIYPGAEEIINNGVDEDCDGEDLLVGIDENEVLKFEVYPNPTDGIIYIQRKQTGELHYRLFSSPGKIVRSGKLEQYIDISNLEVGLYTLEVSSPKSEYRVSKLISLIQ